MRFEPALTLLGELQQKHPEDGPVKLLKARCEELVKQPPDKDSWDGIRGGLRVQDIK